MKTKKALLFSFIFCAVASIANAQKISNVKSLLQKNEYGNWNIIVTPSVIDGYAAETERVDGVYAILLCKNVRGKKSSKYIDITYDLVRKGEKSIWIASSSTKSNQIEYSVTFFRRDLPRSTWPSKESCSYQYDTH